MITDAAQQYLAACLAKQPEAIGVRLSVKHTGCSGLAYVVDYITTPTEQDAHIDQTTMPPIFVDKKSYPFLKQLTVDFVKETFGSKLTFHNPNQTGQCGCGESFTVANTGALL